MLERAIERDEKRLRACFAAATEHHDDPLERLLTVLERIADSAADADAGHRGSLVGTFCNTPGVVDERGRELLRQALISSREPFAKALTEVAERYPIGDDIELDAVADRIFSTLEGGIVMAKALAEPRVFAEQLRLLRTYLGLLFAGFVKGPSAERRGGRRRRPRRERLASAARTERDATGSGDATRSVGILDGLDPAPLGDEQRDRPRHAQERGQAHALVVPVDVLRQRPVDETRHGPRR